MTGKQDQGSIIAKICIDHVLGVDAELLDERRIPGLPDLLYCENGRAVVVEVKQLFDSDYMSFSKASSGSGYTRDARLTKLWTVWLEWAGSVKRARAEISPLLLKLEMAGVSYGSREALFDVDQELYAAARRLRIALVSSIGPTEKHPPGYYLLPAGWGGVAPTTAQLPKLLEETLRGDDMEKLRTQLRRNLLPADEKHAFLIVGPTI